MDLEDRLEDAPRNGIRGALQATHTWVSDTAANVVYGYGYGFIAEYLMAGMTFDEYMDSRRNMNVLNIALGGVYGKIRERVFAARGVDRDELSWRRFTTEIYAILPWIPLYAGGVALSGAPLPKVLEASLLLVALSPIIGPTCGWFTDRIRDLTRANYDAHQIYKPSAGGLPQ